MTQPAYVYIRYSTMDQSKGDSYRRQLDLAKATIDEHGWHFDDKLIILDEGKSAFHAANRAEGAGLFDFEERAKLGHFRNGAVFVVETIDRITRQGFDEAYDFIRKLTRNGVTVALSQTKEVFEAGKRLSMSQVLTTTIKAELGAEESENKSKRVKAAWDKRIVAAQNGTRTAISAVIPGWLVVDPVTRIIKPHPHRAKVLQQIFDWYCEGKGLPWIVRSLNDLKEPTWGRGKHADNKGWNVSTVHKYLTNRTALGEYHPKERVEGRIKVSRGIVIPDYYPQVITAEQFNRVQAIRSQRKRWGGKSQFSLPNLFSGIATCAHCGGPMHMTAQNKAGKPRTMVIPSGRTRVYTNKQTRSYIRCNNARRNFGCANKSGVHYEPLEANVLTALFDLAMGETTFQPNPRIAALVEQIAEQQRLLDLKAQEIENLTANLATVQSRTLMAKLIATEQHIEQGQQTLSELQRALDVEKGKALPEEDLNLLLEARRALQSEDEEVRYAARVKTQQSLKNLIATMACDTNQNTHINLRDHEVYFYIGKDGHMGQMIYAGPDGELDWHPEVEAAE